MDKIFEQAVPIWCGNVKNEWNQFVGFYTKIKVENPGKMVVRVAARSFYRFYVNGEMKAHGPARAGKGYVRADVIELEATEDMHLAFEVAAYNKPSGYSNDITMEPGMLQAEVLIEEQLVAATGQGAFVCRELSYRKEVVELMSHSRGITEQYELSQDAYGWLLGAGEFQRPEICKDNIPKVLERHAPMPDYQYYPVKDVIRIADSVPGERQEASGPEPVLFMQREWCEKIEQWISKEVNSEKEVYFTGKATEPATGLKMELIPGEHPAAISWDVGEAVVGFIGTEITVEEPTILDIVHSDILDNTGKPLANSCMIRYELAPGSYSLISYEPYLVRYVKAIFRTQGKVTISDMGVVSYMYAEQKTGSFLCSDGELNKIYEGAKRTLRNNMLDIFMDCPERERAGWLCDSFWMGRAAYLLLGDTSVERDFLENFLLTDAEEYQYGFFPEVYPGSKEKEKDTGIMSWSFWLGLELCEFYARTGDKEFVERFESRITAFVNGILSFKGESGLLENIPNLFVDWSDSNYQQNLYPISIPTNLLAAFTLESLGELYEKDAWVEEGKEIRAHIVLPDFMMVSEPIKGITTDAVKYVNGMVMAQGGITESGIALEMWSGWYQEQQERARIKTFLERMGPCPDKEKNIQIASANLFIGLMIRWDTLSKMHQVSRMVKEIKHVYLPQLLSGPGTLFEGVSSAGICGSLCHGFNGHAGYLLMKDVLGLGEPNAVEKKIVVAPSPINEMTWAQGHTYCKDGKIAVYWIADYENEKLELQITLPEGWHAEVHMPEKFSPWKCICKMNGKESL